MSFSDLPNELLFLITDQLEIPDLNALIRTNKCLYDLLVRTLYRRDAQASNPIALWWAAKIGSLTVAQLSLSAGADLDSARGPSRPHPCYSCGYQYAPYPLDVAIAERHESVACYLISLGAAVRQEYCDLCTIRRPLNAASRRGLPRTMQALLDHGADIDSQDSYGETPLHCAARIFENEQGPPGQPAIDAVVCLLENGARVSAIDDRGRTPEQLVRGRFLYGNAFNNVAQPLGWRFHHKSNFWPMTTKKEYQPARRKIISLLQAARKPKWHELVLWARYLFRAWKKHYQQRREVGAKSLETPTG